MSEWNVRSSDVEAVLFDLGNTLVSYYRRTEFAPVLQRSIAAAAGALDLHRSRRGALGRPIDVAAATTLAQRFNTERADSRVWPLADRPTRSSRSPTTKRHRSSAPSSPSGF